MKRLFLAGLLAIWLTQAPSAQGLHDGTVLAGGSQSIHDLEGFRYGSLECRFPLKWQRLSALVCLEWNGDDRYVTAGLFLTLVEGRRFRLGIGSGPGFMNNGKSLLGSEIEFRSFAEIQVLVTRRFVWGLDICHYSNGGISSVNPGAESIRLFLAWKLGRAPANRSADDLQCPMPLRPPSAISFTPHY